MQSNTELFNQMSFAKSRILNPVFRTQPKKEEKLEEKNVDNKKISTKKLFPTSEYGKTIPGISLSSQIGIEMFEKYLNYSKKILSCDNTSLVSIS